MIDLLAEANVESTRRYRAMALLCRQQAVLHPDQNWKWLGQAERWEHLAAIGTVQKVDAEHVPPTSFAAA